MKYLVEYDRGGCISAAVCVAMNPKYWELDLEDGKANLKGSSLNKETGMWELTISEDDFPDMKNAAEGCPVIIIHIKNLETGEKII